MRSFLAVGLLALSLEPAAWGAGVLAEYRALPRGRPISFEASFLGKTTAGAIEDYEVQAWLDGDAEDLRGMQGSIRMDASRIFRDEAPRRGTKVVFEARVGVVKALPEPGEYELETALYTIVDSGPPEWYGTGQVRARAVWLASDVRLTGSHRVVAKAGGSLRFAFDLRLRRKDLP